MLKLNKALIGGSLVLLITFNLYNILNFIFQFSMARMLSVIDYGILATLFSIIYISGVFSESIQTIIMKYTSSEKNSGRIKNLMKLSLKKALYVSLILFIIFLFIAIPLKYLLNINYPLLALTGIIIISSFFTPVTRGIMLGKKMFKSLGFNLIAESFGKLVLSIILVFIGLKVYGAIIATIIAVSLAFLFSISSLKYITKSKEKPAKIEGIYQYSVPVFFITLIITLFFSIDIIIAKIMFSEQEAGAYAIASILAKTIFWGTAPISKAMFPLSAENGSDNKKSRNIALNAFIFLFLCIIVILTAFYFFPNLIIKIFSGKELIESSSILFLLGIALSLLSLSNLVLLYKLSKDKTKGYLYSVIFLIIEIVLLFYFSSSLIQFSLALIASSAMFLIGSLFVLREQK